mgnify:CR=1 FL=1
MPRNVFSGLIQCRNPLNDELLVSTLDLDLIEEVRKTWQFYRDRRPETYDKMLEI